METKENHFADAADKYAEFSNQIVQTREGSLLHGKSAEDLLLQFQRKAGNKQGNLLSNEIPSLDPLRNRSYLQGLACLHFSVHELTQ